MNDIELKPCPFCGAPGMLDHYEKDGYLPQCSSGSCWGMIENWFDTPEEAAKVWNSRKDG